MMLQGKAAAAFEAQVASVPNHSMTNATYKNPMDTVTDLFFPKKAA